MSRKKGVHKNLPHTFDEVLTAVARNNFDEKKRAAVTKKFKKEKNKKQE